MPVEETGVKSFAGQFSGFLAGVPIKKRRFPSIQPSSPVSEEPCSLAAETKLGGKENSTTPQGTALSDVHIAGAPIKKRRFPSLQASSSPLEEATPPEDSDALRKEHSSTSQGSTLSASSAGLSDTNENPVCEERKASSDDTKANMVQTANSDADDKANVVRNNSCILVPKLEEPNLGTQSCTLDIVNSIEKVKVVQNEGNDNKLGSQIIKGNPELLLAAKEGLLALSIGADMSKQNVQDLSKQAVPESSSLSLSLKEHLFPAVVASPEVDGESHQKIEKIPISLGLYLSKEECSSKPDEKTGSDTNRAHSNRANWDLNTTMDAWGEPGTDEKLLTCSIERKPLIGAESVKKTLELSQNKASMISSGLYGRKPVASVDQNKDSLISSGLYGRKPVTSVDSVKKTVEESQNKASMISSGLYGRKPVTSVDQNKDSLISSGLYGRKPVTSVDSVKKTLEESQNKASRISSALYGRPYESVDTQSKSLSSRYLQKNAEEPSIFSVKLNPGSVIPAVSLSNVVATAGDTNTSSFRLVKPEPCDENLRKDLKEANSCPVGSVDVVAVKQELLTHVMSSKSSDVSNLKLVDPMFVKSEPGREGSQERSKTAESSTDQLGKELPQGSDNCSSAMPMPVMLKATQISADGAHSPVKTVCTAELTTSENISQLEFCSCAVEGDVEKIGHGASSSSEQVLLETVIPMVDNGVDLSDPGSKNSSILSKEDAADNEGCRLKLMNVPPPDKRVSGEGIVNDEEKVTLSEDDSYGSDFESDDNHAITVGVDTEHVEDDDYEDGEVREPLEPSTMEETICEVREVELPDSSNYESQQVEKGVVSVIDDHPPSSHVAENDNNTEIHSEINNEDGMDIQMLERPGKVVDKNVCVQESFDDENSNIAADRRSVDVLQREPLDLSERIVSETEETEPPSDEHTFGSHVVDVQCAEEVIKTTDTVKPNDFNFPEMEGSANTDDAAKDVNNGGNQGRIIDLSRAAGSSSPIKTRPIPGRSFSSRAGRDVLPDTLDGEKFQRRDDVYMDGPHKFARERNQDMSGGRNSRFNFGRGRGRMNSRMDSHAGEWDSDREYSGDFYNGPTQYRGPRTKYASATADSDMEYNNGTPDGSYAGNGRLGRKLLNDGSYIAPRRRSPGGRDGIQMNHRNPRAMSPNRCMGGEKFMRGYPDDTMDTVFTRPQPFEGMDGRFARGRGRNFSSMQRRGPPRIRSKSPIRSRSRSPGQWSSPRRRSPRRRSPEGFGNHPDHRRSPMYRVDRMRSPPVFHGERVVRRHGSPSFMSRPSNDMRDIDSARDHGHPRPVISNRSPSILVRNRRFDVVDRADNDDDYFGGPMFSGEANGEERRRFGERRGPVRSFRPSYNNNNNNVGESFHINAEDGPRQHYRFCSDDSDFHDRSNNMRERDFDRRVKGRGPGNVPPRRTRNMDEQEENFRHSGQVWNEDSFDDVSRVKRKRF